MFSATFDFYSIRKLGFITGVECVWNGLSPGITHVSFERDNIKQNLNRMGDEL
jgi:hypothetical protein